jgi:hypothetical protein
MGTLVARIRGHTVCRVAPMARLPPRAGAAKRTESRRHRGPRDGPVPAGALPPTRQYPGVRPAPGRDAWRSTRLHRMLEHIA